MQQRWMFIVQNTFLGLIQTLLYWWEHYIASSLGFKSLYFCPRWKRSFSFMILWALKCTRIYYNASSDDYDWLLNFWNHNQYMQKDADFFFGQS